VTYTRGRDLSGSLQRAGGIGGLLARTDNTKLITQDLAGAHAFYAFDGNGNVRAMLGVSGRIAAKYTYGPYGTHLIPWFGALFLFALAVGGKGNSKAWRLMCLAGALAAAVAGVLLWLA